ncbi:hypothetical protein Hanom_Chr16g01443551 [Helianthus anomalus]
MELTSWMKMTRFQTFWIQMRRKKPLDESRKTGQTSRDENGILLFYIIFYNLIVYRKPLRFGQKVLFR